jgi:hypothetical protein
MDSLKGGQAKMASGLLGHPVAEIAEGSRELVTGDVARERLNP